MNVMTVQQKRIKAALNALGVITKDPRIRQSLLSVDPQALHQADEAILDLQLELQPWESIPEPFELAAELRELRKGKQ